MQNSTIDKFKMKGYFENAIKEIDKGNIVEVHQQLELAQKQLDSTPQIQALDPQRASTEQEEE